MNPSNAQPTIVTILAQVPQVLMCVYLLTMWDFIHFSVCFGARATLYSQVKSIFQLYREPHSALCPSSRRIMTELCCRVVAICDGRHRHRSSFSSLEEVINNQNQSMHLLPGKLLISLCVCWVESDEWIITFALVPGVDAGRTRELMNPFIWRCINYKLPQFHSVRSPSSIYLVSLQTCSCCRCVFPSPVMPVVILFLSTWKCIHPWRCYPRSADRKSRRASDRSSRFRGVEELARIANHQSNNFLHSPVVNTCLDGCRALPKLQFLIHRMTLSSSSSMLVVIIASPLSPPRRHVIIS